MAIIPLPIPVHIVQGDMDNRIYRIYRILCKLTHCKIFLGNSLVFVKYNNVFVEMNTNAYKLQ